MNRIEIFCPLPYHENRPARVDTILSDLVRDRPIYKVVAARAERLPDGRFEIVSGVRHYRKFMVARFRYYTCLGAGHHVPGKPSVLRVLSNRVQLMAFGSSLG